jgi:polysaccharide pyruvyl transferase WcaK-like protein
MSRGKVVLAGHYGMRSTGDDVFSALGVEWAARCWASDEISITANMAGLPALPEPVRVLHPRRQRIAGQQRLAVMVGLARAGRVVHVGGSTFFQRQRSHDDGLRLARAGLLRQWAVGISVGPFREGHGPAVAAYLRRFDHIGVRDAASVARLAEVAPDLPVIRGFDPAVLLTTSRWWRAWVPDEQAMTWSRPSSHDAPVLGVSVCRWETFQGGDTAGEGGRLESVVDLVSALVRRTGCTVRLLTLNGHPRSGDHEITSAVAGRLADVTRVEVVGYQPDARRMLAAVQGCRLVIGLRLHASILAYASGVPFVVVPYHQKAIDFAADIGLPPELLLADDPAATAAAAEDRMSGVVSSAPAMPVEEARALAQGAIPTSLT